MRTLHLRLLVHVVALLLLLGLPVATLAAAPRHHTSHHNAASDQPVFELGIQGGNIRPYSVTIESNGQVTVSGPVQHGRTALSHTAVLGLLKLARAEQFYRMPATTLCPGTLPDIASRYIAINTTTRSHRVQVHGGCNPSFNQLYAVLAAVAGIG
jgi:hypothetical protein